MSETDLTGKEVRTLQLPGKMLIVGNQKDEWFYPFLHYVAPEAKRKDYTLYLRTSGVIDLIYKFLVTLRTMTVQPPPEEAIELLLRTMGKKSISNQQLVGNLKILKGDIRQRVNQLRLESEELRMRLENYEALVTPYEILEPNDFAHLGPNPIFGKPSQKVDDTPPSTSGTGDDEKQPEIVVESQQGQESDQESKHSQAQSQVEIKMNPSEAESERSEVIMKQEGGQGSINIDEVSEVSDQLPPQVVPKVHLLKPQKLAVPAINDKYTNESTPTDLDIQGLSEYMTNFGAMEPVEEEELKKTKKATKNKCGTLPKIEIPSEDLIDINENEMIKKLPPLLILQGVKYQDY